MTVREKGRYKLLKKAERLKHVSSTKNTAANKATKKYKKQCQMLQLLSKKKNKLENYWYLASTTHISLTFQVFCCKTETAVVKLKSSNYLLSCITLKSDMVLAFKKSNKCYCVHAAKAINHQILLNSSFQILLS